MLATWNWLPVVLHVVEEGEQLLLMCVSCCCAGNLELAAVILHVVEEGEQLLLLCCLPGIGCLWVSMLWKKVRSCCSCV